MSTCRAGCGTEFWWGWSGKAWVPCVAGLPAEQLREAPTGSVFERVTPGSREVRPIDGPSRAQALEDPTRKLLLNHFVDCPARERFGRHR